MIDYEIAILIGAIAFTYSALLTGPNKLLNSAYNWLYSAFKTDERAEQGKPVHWLFMILMYCEQCIAGQIALWSFLVRKWYMYYEDPFNAAFCHSAFVSVAIITAAFLKSKHNQ